MSESELRIAAQIALLGEVPASLRSVSLALSDRALRFRAIFQNGAKEDDFESLRCAATEVLAALPSSLTIEEELFCSDRALRENEHSLVVFRRKESE